MITYNNIINAFATFASEHSQINSFGYGSIDDIGSFEVKQYPFLFVSPKSSVIRSNSATLKFNVLLMDKLREDNYNEQEIHSDVLSIIGDFRSWLDRSSYSEYSVTEQNNIYPFSQRFGDYVAGWTYELELETEMINGLCNIPGISPFTYDANGNYINTNYSNLLVNYLPLSGGTMTGCLYGTCSRFDSLTGITYYSGSTPLQTIIYNIASQFSGGTGGSGNTYSFSAGTNLYVSSTGNTIEFGTLSTITFNDVYTDNIFNYGNLNNIGTLNTTGLLTATDILCLNSLSANSFEQTSTLDNIFSGHTTFYDDIDVGNAINAVSLSISNQIDTVTFKATGLANFTSAATINILSANTIVSAGTNLNQIFASINHSHPFSALTNSAHTHSISDINNLSTQLSTKANLSGANFSNGLSADTIYSGSNNISTYFPFDQSSMRIKGSTFDRYHTFAKVGFSFSNIVLVANRLYAFPLILGEAVTLDRIGISIQATSSATTAATRIGLYSSGANKQPTNLIADYGTIPLSATSNLSLITISQSLSAGLYFLSILPNSAETLRGIPTTAIDGIVGFGSNVTLGMGGYISQNQNYGALPSSFTATTFNTAIAPAVFYRLA